MRLILFLCALLIAGTGCSQQPQWRYIGITEDLLLPVGDTTITASRTVYNDTSFPFFLHLHHNESTAESSIERYLGEHGGTSLVLMNNRQRNLSFTLSGKRYVADPNRIFTPAGIQQNLRLLSTYDSNAATALTLFAQNISAQLPDSLPVIAVHNNSDGAYAILSYAPKGTLSKDAARIHYNPKMDADDFVLTTDERLFGYLQKEDINAVLQANTLVADDGSLSVVMGRQGRVYANIEAEHGHEQVQLQLLKLIAAFVQQQYRNSQPQGTEQDLRKPE